AETRRHQKKPATLLATDRERVARTLHKSRIRSRHRRLNGRPVKTLRAAYRTNLRGMGKALGRPSVAAPTGCDDEDSLLLKTREACHLRKHPTDIAGVLTPQEAGFPPALP